MQHNLTKEQLLEILQSSLLTLKDKGKKLFENKELFEAWKKQNTILQEGVKKLNSCDMLWLSENYEQWYKNVLTPLDAETKEKFKDQLDWL